MLDDGEVDKAVAAEETHYDFDLFVIGAGSGGVRAARFSANHGAKVIFNSNTDNIFILLLLLSTIIPNYILIWMLL